ncbi:MAG: nitroreductase family protein, partial [Verrucomicrobiota bacterium]|nr:nitroreductase family protein [Verrucomicrobiota bacterium]
SRQSIRKFDRRKKVSRDLITKCLEVARLAPSACNKQPWRFTIVDSEELLKKIAKESQLPGIPHEWFETVPVFVVLSIDSDFLTHKIASAISGIKYNLIDAGIAGEHFVLAAESLGLATCWIGWFNPKKIRKLLNIPRKIKIVSLIALGYPDNFEKKEKKRIPLSEIASLNSWDIPYQEI